VSVRHRQSRRSRHAPVGRRPRRRAADLQPPEATGPAAAPPAHRPPVGTELRRRIGERSGWEALGALVAVATLITVTGAGDPVLRLLAGLPLVLVVPGHALVALAWPGQRLGMAERALLDLGLSLALAALSGLALNWTPWGLGGVQPPLLLGLFSLAGIAVVARREPRRPWSAALAGWRRSAAPGSHHAVLGGTAAALVATAVAFSVWSAAQDRGPGFTQAWLVPRAAGRLDIGLRNDQARADTYRLRLTAGGRTVREWPAVRLRPGQQWSAAAALPDGAATGAELAVYRAEQPAQVYRSLRVAPGGGAG
jgi:hypothetical protein